MDLPSFKYHPAPLETGAIVLSDQTCTCCQRARGYVYVGPVYAERSDLDGKLCPWCIADGSAAERFEAELTDSAGVGGYDEDVTLDQAIIDEVAQRTPGFLALQQEQWLACCDDACAFVGRVGDEYMFRCLHCGKSRSYADAD